MSQPDVSNLPTLVAEMAYSVAPDGVARIRVFPPSSGREVETPAREKRMVSVFDCRPLADELKMDVAGFELHSDATGFADYYSPEQVRQHYYPEVVALLTKKLDAQAVFVFDHNVRSRVRSARKEVGVREPVEGAHNDYTLASGPKRIEDILRENNAHHLLANRAALINVWRPIVGPVQDHPLAICDARSTTLKDFIATEIQHFQEDDLETPAHVGEVFSFKHNPAHRWYYASEMQPDEVIFLKCFDTALDGRARYTGHTGFQNPDCPTDFVARESIEARTVVVFPELRPA
jgi:hypothetical protein